MKITLIPCTNKNKMSEDVNSRLRMAFLKPFIHTMLFCGMSLGVIYNLQLQVCLHRPVSVKTL